jgi:uncharacterized protein YjbI with pentapeptide repeats
MMNDAKLPPAAANPEGTMPNSPDRPTDVAQPEPESDSQTFVVCPACKGEGFLGWVGTASTCIFCLGEHTVSAAEARLYNRGADFYGAEPTLRRVMIAVNELGEGELGEWLERYDFQLEELEEWLDEDQLDRFWGFHRRNFAGRDFTEEDLEEVYDFSGSNLTGANFHAVDLEDADFSDATLTGANLTKANLTGASLREARLVGASLAESTLTNADVTGADFRGVTDLDLAALEDLRTRGAIVNDPAS